MQIPVLHSLSARNRRLVIGSVSLVLFYTLFGFFILPLIVRSVATKQLSKQLDREVSIGQVKINPYAMSATIRAFLVKDKDGQPFISWDEVYANFQFYSLFTRTFVFREIRTAQPYLRVQVNKDYSLNFSDILEKIAKEAADAPQKEPSRPLALRVEQFNISAARLSATDLTTKEPFTKVIGPLELNLQNFATNPDSKNPYSFAGSTEEGERFSWNGHFFLAPIRSTGEFSLENISLAKYALLYQDLVRFDIRDGIVDVRSSYHVEQGAQTNIARFTNAMVAVNSLKVAEHGAADNAMEVAQFTIAGVSADAFGRNAEVGSITTSNGRLALRRNADATVNLIELSKPSSEATNTAGSVAVLLQSLTNVIELLLRSTNSWAGAIREIQVDNYAVRLEDLANARPVRLDLDNIQLKVRNVSNVPGTNISAELSMRWNTNGLVKADTTLSLFPVQAEVKLALENIEIRALDPYLDPFVRLLITDGRVGMEGVMELAVTTNGLPEVTFRGEVRVDDFSTVDGVMTEDFLKWKSLRFSGIHAQLDPMEVAVKEVSVTDAYARLVIAEDSGNNLFAVLRKSGVTTPVPESTPGVNEPPKPAGKGKSPLSIHLPTNAVALPGSLPKITVEKVTLSNANVNFIDRSVKPGVTLSVQQVEGTISGLSSEELARADVNLRGKVDNVAPMEITGKINPLSQKGFTDIIVRFQGIELVPTSPYAGKFIGYRLTKGKLSLDLHYQLAEGKVKGANLVTLDQLTLGEKVESPDATKLPVRLALAVLKDRSGKIDLDVPVEGSLSDPEFKLGKVITRALLNVITKIATSPFAVLGSVFGGKGEEVSFQDFAPGAAELQPANIQKLDLLVKGLYERPALQLEIEGSVGPDADRDALRRQKMEKELRMKKWLASRKSERSRVTPEQIQFTPEEYADFIRESYAIAFAPGAVAARATQTGQPGSEPGKTLPVVASGGGDSGKRGPEVKGATALMSQSKRRAPKLPPQDMESKLLETIDITDADFASLASARAMKVKEYILQTGKVEAERLFLTEKSDAARTNQGSRVYLHLR